MATKPALEVRLTGSRYRHDIETLRRVMADRSATISEIRLLNPAQADISLFMRHRDLYVVGFDFGHGGYRFSDQPGLENARVLEFGGNYKDLGLDNEADDRLSFGRLDGWLRQLAKIAASDKGSNIHAGDRVALGVLILVVAEAMRFQTIQDAVEGVLRRYEVVNFKRFLGETDEVRNWKKYSAEADWQMYGIKARHLA